MVTSVWLLFLNLNAWYTYQENKGYSNESSHWQSLNFEVTHRQPTAMTGHLENSKADLK
jgi:hypothetical protein